MRRTMIPRFKPYGNRRRKLLPKGSFRRGSMGLREAMRKNRL